MRTIVLGAGRVGQAIARDLAADPSWKVTLADRSSEALGAVVASLRRYQPSASIATIEAELSDPREIARLVADQELVVGALPSFLGFAALRAVLETAKPYVDISFFEEDPSGLDELASRRGAVALVDCGLAPGLSNLILGYSTTVFDHVERFACYVGGLPRERRWPWEYKAPFAPYDVINEYVRPARLVENGRTVVRPALSEPELMDFPPVGTLEAFNTDGLRTLLAIPVPFMKEMTLRYPGHAEKMRMLRESGFFSAEPVTVDGVSVSPLELTSKLLFRQWRFGEDEEDLTVMRVVVEGRRQERRERHIYDLHDLYDPAAGLSSMARTTGFTCAAMARLVAAGRFRRQGIFAPEHLGMEPGGYEAVMADLEARRVRFEHRVEILDEPPASPA